MLYQINLFCENVDFCLGKLNQSPTTLRDAPSINYLRIFFSSVVKKLAIYEFNGLRAVKISSSYIITL